jgi:hypothetical protein
MCAKNIRSAVTPISRPSAKTTMDALRSSKKKDRDPIHDRSQCRVKKYAFYGLMHKFLPFGALRLTSIHLLHQLKQRFSPELQGDGEKRTARSVHSHQVPDS